MNRTVFTKLDPYPTVKESRDKEVREQDTKYKQKLKTYHDTRHRAREHAVKAGEAILLKH